MSSPDPPMRHSGRRPVAQAPDVVDVDQTFDVDGLYALRETLAAHAGRLGATNDQVDDLLIVAGELATNAVRHGGGVGRLRLWHRGSILYCQVSDRGPGITDLAVGTTHPGPTGRDGGRGLWICRNIATELIIDTGPDGRGAIVTAVVPGETADRP